jgi:hypothetical protein
MKNETKKRIVTNCDRIRKPCFDDGTNGETQDCYDFQATSETNSSLHTLEQKGTLTTSNKIENLEVFDIGIWEEEI